MTISKVAAEAAVSGAKANVGAAMTNYFAGHSDGKHRSKVQAMAKKTGGPRVTFFQKSVRRDVKVGEQEVQVEQKGWGGSSTTVTKKVAITESRVFYEDMSESDEQKLVELSLKSAAAEYYAHVQSPETKFHLVCPLPPGIVAGEVTLGQGNQKGIAVLDRVSIVIVAGEGANHQVATVMAESSAVVANWRELV